MNLKISLTEIPRGNTARGVLRAIIGYLVNTGLTWHGKNILDIPCGQGDLIATLRQFFPGARVLGCDVQAPQTISPTDFALVDASRSFHVFPPTKFDLVLSVSGVMEFDNTLQFLNNARTT